MLRSVLLALITVAAVSVTGVSRSLAMPADTVVIDDDSSFDVSYVKLDLSIQPDTEYIGGSVLIRSHAVAIRNDRTIKLSLREQLQVDSVINDGAPITS